MANTVSSDRNDGKGLLNMHSPFMRDLRFFCAGAILSGAVAQIVLTTVGPADATLTMFAISIVGGAVALVAGKLGATA